MVTCHKKRGMGHQPKSAPFFFELSLGSIRKITTEARPSRKLDRMSFMPEECEKTEELPTDLGVLKVHHD
jgi:hypothetical protein